MTPDRGQRRAPAECRTRAVLAAGVIASSILLGTQVAGAATDPLAGVVLEDGEGRRWSLDELRGAPVAVIVAGRAAVDEARAWGERLATESRRLAPWPALGKVTWLTIADLRGVPEYARAQARARIRAWEDARGAAERGASAPLLQDWDGVLAARLGGERGTVLVAVLAPDHRTLASASGAPTAAAVARIVAAIDAAAAPAPPPAPESR